MVMQTVTGVLMLGNGHKRTIPIALKTHLPYCDTAIAYDGSNDGSWDIVKDTIPNRIIQHFPIDFSRFKNEAMQEAKTPWIFFFCTDEYFWCTMQPVVFKQTLFASRNVAFKIPRFNYPFAPDFPDYQTDIVKKGCGGFKDKLHETWAGPPSVLMPHTIKIHMPASRSFLKWRDERFPVIDIARQEKHLSRPEIQQRVKDEYAYAPESD
jgi:hypothetical protein